MRRALLLTKKLAIVLVLLFAIIGTSLSQRARPSFKKLLDAYTREFLVRNPSVSTYRGGAGWDASLTEADGRLRDHSPSALGAEDRWLSSALKTFEAISPAELEPAERIDREVALSQIRFLLHQHQVRRYQQRTEAPLAVREHLQRLHPAETGLVRPACDAARHL